MCAPRRLAVLDGVLSVALCQELLLVARSLAVVGYRPGVCSSTIFEVATAAPALLPPLVAAREAVRAAVEEALGLQLGLMIEFTGLICWRPGSCIGWHHDANRPYLRQRTHSAVCYLNSAGSDFQGGTFQFQQQEESGATSITSVAYDARESHCVLPVASGERFSLALWFTEDPSHSEDTRLLAQMPGPVERSLCALGLPATMWALPDGTDLRLCRLAMAGFALVWQGRLLHCATDLADSEGGERPRLQLAVQPAMLRAWLGWHQQQQAAAAVAAEAGAAGGSSRTSNAQKSSAGNAEAATAAEAAAGGAGLTAAVLVKGIEFEGLQEAALCVQRWAWQRCPGGWGRERVCCAHLNEAPADKSSSPAPTCTWLRSCQLDSSGCQSAVEPCELQAALTASRAHLASQQAVLAALHPRWLQLGAFFCDSNPCVT